MKEYNLNIKSALYVTFDNTNTKNSQKFLPFIIFLWTKKDDNLFYQKSVKTQKGISLREAFFTQI